LDLLTYSIYIFVSLTRLFLNLYTAHSDVGGTVTFRRREKSRKVTLVGQSHLRNPEAAENVLCFSRVIVSLKIFNKTSNILQRIE
jgi:hypothetical protein